MTFRSKSARACLAAIVLIAVAFAGYRVILWRQISQFQSLTPTMRAEDVMRSCGKPERLSGAGFLFLHYRLIDGSEVVVRCGGGLRVMTAMHGTTPLFEARP